MQRMLSNPSKEKELGTIQSLISLEAPKTEFNIKEPSWNEVQEVIISVRSASAPCPNGLLYGVYKQLPRSSLLIMETTKINMVQNQSS